jgi:salicylate hydroxylase
METAKVAIRNEKASSRFMYNGPDGHVITYPVSQGSMLNVLVVTNDYSPWKEPRGKTTTGGSKIDVAKFFENWHDMVRAIVGLLPDKIDKWALFDHFDNQAPPYNKGLIGLAGDAAHAMGPHLGSGAAMGLEDAAVLAILIARAEKFESLRQRGVSRQSLLEAALEVYNDIRYDRTQWLVRNTREAGDMYNWQHPSGRDGQKFGQEITAKLNKIWDFDVEDMLDTAVERFNAVVELRLAVGGLPEKRLDAT